jgi:uncharacterized glyoxalase superfamily protein PhnB
MNTTQARKLQSIYPVVRYNDAKAAIQWLTSVLGFEENVVYPGEGESIAHAQLQLGGDIIMLGSAKDDAYGNGPKNPGGMTRGVYIALENPTAIGAAYARAEAAGAEIIRKLEDTDYGSREFGVCDPEGHVWSFGTYRPQAE